VVADAILSPLTPTTKFKLNTTHEVFVEPSEVEGSTPVFELHSPDGDKRPGRMERSGGRRY
jgi:hypothetical protein